METNLSAKFRRLAREMLHDYFYYKIPDTKGLGGNRPFDAILSYNGVSFAIEYKDGTNKATSYQIKMVNRFIISGGWGMILHPSCDIRGWLVRLKKGYWERCGAGYVTSKEPIGEGKWKALQKKWFQMSASKTIRIKQNPISLSLS